MKTTASDGSGATEGSGRSTAPLPPGDPGAIRLSVSQVIPPDWIELVDRLRGNIYHSREWASITESAGKRPQYFLWSDHQGARLGLALGAESRSSLPLVGKIVRHLHFETYPLAKDASDDLTQRMVSDIRDYAHQEKYLSLSLDSYCARGEWAELDHLGFRAHRRIEFSVDLTPDSEELWGGLSGSHRRKIRKARKHSLELVVSSEPSALRDMRKLQVASTERRIQRGESIATSDDSHFQELGSGYMEQGLGRVFLVVEDGKPISAAFFTVFRDEALYVWGGSSDRGFSTNAPALLFWSALERLRGEGVRLFNLGGTPAEASDPESESHGLYRFKKGFGGGQKLLANGKISNENTLLGTLVRVGRLLLRRR